MCAIISSWKVVGRVLIQKFHIKAILFRNSVHIYLFSSSSKKNPSLMSICFSSSRIIMSDPSRMLTFSSFFSSHFHRKHISMYPQENERIDQEVVHKGTDLKLTSKNVSYLWQSMEHQWIFYKCMEKMVIMNSVFYIAFLTKFEPVWIWNNNKVWEHRIGERAYFLKLSSWWGRDENLSSPCLIGIQGTSSVLLLLHTTEL